jgi:hypothetical protein
MAHIVTDNDLYCSLIEKFGMLSANFSKNRIQLFARADIRGLLFLIGDRAVVSLFRHHKKLDPAPRLWNVSS